MMVIYSAFLTLSKAVLQDSRYFSGGGLCRLTLFPAPGGPWPAQKAAGKSP